MIKIGNRVVIGDSGAQIHNCVECGGRGWYALPLMHSEDEYEQVPCEKCSGCGSVVELEDGTIVSNN